MKNKRHISSRVIELISLSLLFVLAVFYFSSFSSYIFFFQEKSLLFLGSFSYLAEHLNQPGGFLVYLSNFQTALYYYPFAGAVIVSLEIVIIIYLIIRIALKLVKRRFHFLAFLIGASLLYLQTHYEYTAIHNLGILCQLGLFFLFISYLNDGKAWVAVVLFPGIYFLFGVFCVVFLLMITIFFLQKKELLKLIAIWLTGLFFFFLGKEFLFFQTTATLISFPFSADKTGEQPGLYFFVGLLIAVSPCLFLLKLNRISNISFKKIKIEALTPLLILAVLTLLSVQRIDKKKSHYFQVEKLFYEQKYEELIAFCSQNPPTHMFSTYLTNIALAETGRLSASFLRFWQSPEGQTLFLKWEITDEILKLGGHFYYSIGMINEAHRWAYEYMVFRGNSPETLKMMIKTDLIKGKYKTAEMYISILEKSVFYRKEAKYLKTFLYNEKGITLHPELGWKKSLEVKQDFFVHPDHPHECLDLIIESDSTNRMAIEYKLAWMMLQKDMQGVVSYLPVMEKAGYKRIPKNVEEAVLAFKLVQIGEMPELERLQTSSQTEVQFQNFNQVFMQYQGNKQQLQPVLARDFSDTYWYYVFSN